MSEGYDPLDLKQLAFDFESGRNGTGDWFSAQLFRLILKADAGNQERLARGFPAEVGFVATWNMLGEKWLMEQLNSIREDS